MKIKANKTTYILLLVVVGIWGYFIVSLLSDLNPEFDTPEQFVAQSPRIKNPTEKEKFELIETTRDPFDMPKVNKSTTSNREKTTLKKKELSWPSINYLGTISDGGQKQSIYVVSINGKQQLLKKGQSANEVTLVRASAKEIVVKFEGDTKIIALQ